MGFQTFFIDSEKEGGGDKEDASLTALVVFFQEVGEGWVEIDVTPSFSKGVVDSSCI